jgi:hypothetical protein
MVPTSSRAASPLIVMLRHTLMLVSSQPIPALNQASPLPQLEVIEGSLFPGEGVWEVASV